MNATQPPPQQIITDINKSPLIQVIAWFMLSIGVLSWMARVGTKIVMVGNLKLDDHLSLASLVTAIIQSIAVLLQCSHGLGKHQSDISAGDVSSVHAWQYVGDVFFIISLAFSKSSLAVAISSLNPRRRQTLAWAVQGVIGLWTLSAVFVVLFQCELPSPWNYVNHKCIDRSAFWVYFSISNILTDLVVVAVMVESVMRIQTSWGKKGLVMGVFGSRVVMIPVIVFQLYYSKSAYASKDQIFDMWEASVFVQVVQALSLLTASVPILKPFLDSLESGGLRGDDLRRKMGTSGYKGGRYAYGYKGNTDSGRLGSKPLQSADGMLSSTSKISKVHELVELPKGGRTTATVTHEPTGSWDGQSRTSQKGLIQQTTTWEVNVERRDSHSAPPSTIDASK